jgi:thiol-disulfide isomerase/thioredoxin
MKKIILFASTKCGPCKMITPLLEQIKLNKINKILIVIIVVLSILLIVSLFNPKEDVEHYDRCVVKYDS